jgi:hypothetical protein
MSVISVHVPCNREFTNVKRRRQDEGHQYNDITSITQNKWIIKSIAGNSYFHNIMQNAYFLVKYASISSSRGMEFVDYWAELIKIALKIKAQFYSF